MKKALSIVLAVLMLASVVALAVMPMAAGNDPAGSSSTKRAAIDLTKIANITGTDATVINADGVINIKGGNGVVGMDFAGYPVNDDTFYTVYLMIKQNGAFESGVGVVRDTSLAADKGIYAAYGVINSSYGSSKGLCYRAFNESESVLVEKETLDSSTKVESGYTMIKFIVEGKKVTVQYNKSNRKTTAFTYAHMSESLNLGLYFFTAGAETDISVKDVMITDYVNNAGEIGDAMQLVYSRDALRIEDSICEVSGNSVHMSYFKNSDGNTGSYQHLWGYSFGKKVAADMEYTYTMDVKQNKGVDGNGAVQHFDVCVAYNAGYIYGKGGVGNADGDLWGTTGTVKMSEATYCFYGSLQKADDNYFRIRSANDSKKWKGWPSSKIADTDIKVNDEGYSSIKITVTSSSESSKVKYALSYLNAAGEYVEHTSYDIDNSNGALTLGLYFLQTTLKSDYNVKNIAFSEKSTNAPVETTPEDTTPAATLEVTTPEETTPAATPEVTTPEVTTPAATTPEVTTPESTTAGDSTPSTGDSNFALFALVAAAAAVIVCAAVVIKKREN